MDTCREIQFDIAATAELYSTLAGVLAGFAFTTLMLLVTTRLGADSQEDPFADASRVLIGSFIALVLASLGYAVLAGSTVSSGRAATEESILGLGFASAGVLMLYAIMLTLDAVESNTAKASESGREVALFMRRILGQFVTPLLMFYVYMGVLDYTAIRYGREHHLQPLEFYGLSLVAIQIVIGLVGYSLWSRHKAAQSQAARRERLFAKALTTLFLIISFATTVGFAAIEGVYDACDTVAPIIPTTVLTITFFVMATTTYLLAVSRPRVSAVETLRSNHV